MSVITDNSFGQSVFKSSELPKELQDQMFSTFRQKLPPEVEDSVIIDIMETNQQLIKNYFLSSQQS